MSDHKTIALWHGRRLEELSREELEEAVRELGREIARERNSHQRTLEIWEHCRRRRA